MTDVERIEKWLRATKLAPSTLGNYACNNPRAIDRIKSGTGEIGTLRQVIKYIETHPVIVRRK